MKRRKTEIIVETQEVFTLKRPQFPFPGWCPQCGSDSRLITPDEAALLCDVSTREIYRWIEALKIHFIERGGGGVLICLSSVVALTEDAAESLLTPTNDLIQ